MEDSLLDLFAVVANGFHARLQELAGLEQLDLSPFQARTISLIARNEGCSQQMLSTWAERDKAQVARTIKELETRGLITRQAHRSDWRAQSLWVTPAGKQASNVLNRQRKEAGEQMLRDVLPEERQVLSRILSKMHVRLSVADAMNSGLIARAESATEQ